MQAYLQGDLKEAKRLQAIVARADWVAIKGGFVAVKVGLRKFGGYGGLPRLPTALPEAKARIDVEEGFAEVMEVEKGL